MNIHQAKAILENYRNGTSSLEEKQMVEEWYARLVETGEWEWGDGEKEQLRRAMEARLLQQINAGHENEVHRIRFIKTARWWWAAASIIIMIGISSYFFYFNKTNNKQQSTSQQFAHDVKAPQTNRAAITLANGNIVYLDSAGNGTIATQGGIDVVKNADGKLVYNNSQAPSPSERAGGEVYNTLNNPRGSKVIDITFSDGSHVSLDASSSVTYPVSFIGNERKVSVTGQAYFEVKHDAARPFIVSKGQTSITVLGTHFNVNAYDDDPDIKVTLLEGSVKVNNNAGAVTIKPGQQAQVTGNQQPVTSNNVDLDQVMAWRNGEFQFGDRADISTIMRQLARWYNIVVEYKGNINTHIGGTISRNVNISQVLSMLQETGAVQFKVEGNKVTVLPGKQGN